jgi:hypothetical protein
LVLGLLVHMSNLRISDYISISRYSGQTDRVIENNRKYVI